MTLKPPFPTQVRKERGFWKQRADDFNRRLDVLLRERDVAIVELDQFRRQAAHDMAVLEQKCQQTSDDALAAKAASDAAILDKDVELKQKTAYEISLGLVGSEMCIRDSSRLVSRSVFTRFDSFLDESSSLVEFSKSGPFP